MSIPFRPILLVLVFPSAAFAAAPITFEEFPINRPYGKLAVAMQTSAQPAEDPLVLLIFSTDRKSSLVDGRYGAIVRPFLDQGHRVVSFDLPAHGDRIDEHGSGIVGLYASVAAGKKPFDLFVEDGKAVIDELIRRGLAKPGRIVTCGVSRGGYCALRLAAADDRISAVCALAPATDWGVVTEFTQSKDTSGVKDLALTNFADKLAGRRIYVAIGNADSRAGTDACTRFVLSVNKAEKQRRLKTSGLRYLVVDDSVDHSLNSRWRKEGIQFLLNSPPAANKENLPQ